MYRIVSQMWVGNMPLHAMMVRLQVNDPRRPFFTTSPTTRYSTVRQPGSNRDAHYVPSSFDDFYRTVMGTGFLIRSDQNASRPVWLGCCATKRSAATTSLPASLSYLPHRARITYRHDGGFKRRIDPTIGVARRHHVVCPAKANVSPCPRHAQKFCVRQNPCVQR